MGNKLKDGQEWIAENGCFNERTFIGEPAWFAWLGSPKLLAHQATCLFATAPDVVGDAEATWARSKPWLPKIRGLGYKAAFVAQDGIGEWLEIPWDDYRPRQFPPTGAGPHARVW